MKKILSLIYISVVYCYSQPKSFYVNLDRMTQTHMIYRTSENIYLLGYDYAYRPLGAKIPLNGSYYQFLSVGEASSYNVGNINNLPSTFENNANAIEGDYYKIDFNHKINSDINNAISIKWKKHKEEFEYKNESGVETFKKIDGKQYENFIAFIAQSTYTKRKYLFIQEVGSHDKYKIDITESNPHIKHHSNGETLVEDVLGNQRNDFSIISYYQNNQELKNLKDEIRREYTEHVITIATKTRVFYYVIMAGKVSRINYLEYPNNDYLKNVYYYDKKATWINHFKTPNGNKLIAYHTNSKVIWEKNVTNFSSLNQMFGCNYHFVIGGATEKFGYLGYSNPYIEILDCDTGEIKTAYFKSEKNSSVNTIYAKKNEIILTIGYQESDESKLKDAQVTLFKDWISNEGKFVVNYFKQIN